MLNLGKIKHFHSYACFRQIFFSLILNLIYPSLKKGLQLNLDFVVKIFSPIDFSEKVLHLRADSKSQLQKQRIAVNSTEFKYLNVDRFFRHFKTIPCFKKSLKTIFEKVT